MSVFDVVSLAAALGGCALAAPFLGRYLHAVFEGRPHPLSFLAPAERGLLRLFGPDAARDMDAAAWIKAIALFSLLSIGLLWAILAGQAWLPFNPQCFPGLGWDLALNTAVSFATNTDWQAYAGESSLSYFSQMAGLTVQNFLSPAVGLAAALALVRGLRARRAPDGQAPAGLGNCWVDITRAVLYVLLPLSVVVALVLVGQGVVQSLAPYQHFAGIAGKPDLLPLGPAASQVAIKQLGSNGGGFFGANSLHPFENPTGLSNLVELASILLIPMAIPFLYGRLLGKPGQGRALFAAMFVLLGLAMAGGIASELAWGIPEGKDLRFDGAASAAWAIATTATSNGSVNAALDSLTPLAGGLALLNVMLGEVVFGGVGCGLYGMLAFVLVTVFLVGLMVGRTPEFLGKKIEAREVKLAMAAVLVPSVGILAMTALALAVPGGLDARANGGPHGLSEILYAYASGFGNNGSAFAGLSANTVFFNLSLAFAMLVGRFAVMFPVLALAGSFAVKKSVAAGTAAFATEGPLFTGLLVAMVLILGALTHFPALVLGPALDHFLMLGGIRV